MECTLYLTDDCNLQCSYCYEGNKKNKSYMTEATLEKTLDFIVNNNPDNDYIDLFLRWIQKVIKQERQVRQGWF